MIRQKDIGVPTILHHGEADCKLSLKKIIASSFVIADFDLNVIASLITRKLKLHYVPADKASQL
jgi:hypothetical protein